MARRHKLYIAAATLLLTIVTGVVVVSIVGTKAERAFGRIQVGMRPVEVAEAVGQSPGHWDAGIGLPPSYSIVEMGLLLEYPIGSGHIVKDDYWRIDDYSIIVTYDSSYKVCAYYLIYHKPSLLDRLKMLVGG